MTRTKSKLFIFSGFVFLALGLSLTLYKLSNVLVQAMPSDGSTPVHLTLLPDPPTLYPGETGAIAVIVHPNGRQVSAVELHLTFDPLYLSLNEETPIATATSALSWILPNCQAGPAPSPNETCPQVPLATSHELLVYLAAPCTEAGCTLPSTTDPFEIARVFVTAKAHNPGITNLSTVASGSATLIAAFNSDSDVTGVASPATLTLTACHLAYDLAPNQVVDVVDIMKVAAIWNSQAGSATYNGQMDLDHNHTINVVDIQKVASNWSQSCQP